MITSHTDGIEPDRVWWWRWWRWWWWWCRPPPAPQSQCQLPSLLMASGMIGYGNRLSARDAIVSNWFQSMPPAIIIIIMTMVNMLSMMMMMKDVWLVWELHKLPDVPRKKFPHTERSRVWGYSWWWWWWWRWRWSRRWWWWRSNLFGDETFAIQDFVPCPSCLIGLIIAFILASFHLIYLEITQRRVRKEAPTKGNKLRPVPKDFFLKPKYTINNMLNARKGPKTLFGYNKTSQD